MKKLVFMAAMLAALGVSAQQNQPATTNNAVPDAVLTDDSAHWTISTLSTIGYVNTTPGANYNTYRSGGGMLVKFKFKKNGRYEFMLYVQANTYGTATESWTQVEGTVTYTKDAKGQQVLLTKAEKGTYRITKNGSTTSRPIPESELKGQHSGKFIWEKTSFPDDPNNIYLLMVDLKKYPDADINKPGSIDPSMVSKFHIPVKK